MGRRKRRGSQAARPLRGERLEWRHYLSGVSPMANPATANAAFVQAVYQDVLGRPVDPVSLAWGVGEINAGVPRATFADQVIVSNEAFRDFITATYQHFLGRTADEISLQYWLQQMRAGMTNQQIEATLLGSDEFYLRAGGTQSDWVQAAYQTVLGRAAESSAVTWVESQLAAGESLYDVGLSLLMSGEGTTRTVVHDLSQLQLSLDAGTVSTLASQLGTWQTTEQELMITYVAKSQYFDLHTGVPVTTVPVPNVLAGAPERTAAIAAEAAQAKPNVLFLGDSITQLWTMDGISAWNQYFAPLGSFDAGVGGDTIENVLWRLDAGDLAGISPKLAVLMIGVNDLADSPNDIAAGITAVVQKLQDDFPGIKVLLLGLLPALQPEFGSVAQQQISQVNALLSPLMDGQRVWFLDVDASFQNPDGSMNTSLYNPDHVHPNAAGFDVLAQAIAPWVDALS
ncbi:MAG TPA: GDSL-type esterase/lipase family protein [Pirellulales bacterium]|nr:GDSL-type esterase/lipase family protein [Pirellulales bacterium]